MTVHGYHQGQDRNEYSTADNFPVAEFFDEYAAKILAHSICKEAGGQKIPDLGVVDFKFLFEKRDENAFEIVTHGQDGIEENQQDDI